MTRLQLKTANALPGRLKTAIGDIDQTRTAPAFTAHSVTEYAFNREECIRRYATQVPCGCKRRFKRRTI